MDEHPAKPSLLDRLSAVLSREPETRAELVETLRSAYERHLIDDDALSMTEGALQVSEINVDEIMIPRSQAVMIDINASTGAILRDVIRNGHSRFPVFDGNRDNIIGVLLAKDLLRTFVNEDIAIRELLRPAVFIPEAKKLNVLLRDFRMNRNHIAIVVDEYGGVAGIVTIEDVLEQIVGDIEDEYDYDDSAEDWAILCSDNRYRVATKVGLEEFNQFFGTDFSTEEADTLGGLLIRRLGHLPQRGEEITVDGLHFEVTRADLRRVYTVMMDKIDATPAHS